MARIVGAAWYPVRNLIAAMTGLRRLNHRLNARAWNREARTLEALAAAIAEVGGLDAQAELVRARAANLRKRAGAAQAARL